MTIAEQTARRIARDWQSGAFRASGGVVQGMTPIIQTAMNKAIKAADRDWTLALARRRRKGLR